MKTHLFHDGPRFRIISHGNGLAYQFINKPENMEAFFQGDDATMFENEIDQDQRDLDAIWGDYCAVAETFKG